MVEKLVKKVIQVDVLALIQRYSTEQGVQLNRGQQSLIELSSKPEINFDPIMLVLIAHFFENLPADDIDKLPEEQKVAAKQLKRFAPCLTTAGMQTKLAEAHRQTTAGKVPNLTADMGVAAEFDGTDEEWAKIKSNNEFAKAMAMMKEARDGKRPLRQDEINTIINLLGRDIQMTPEMWKHVTDKMEKDKKLDKQDKEAMLKYLTEPPAPAEPATPGGTAPANVTDPSPGVVTMDKLEKHLAPKLKATLASSDAGRIYLEGGSTPPEAKEAAKQPPKPLGVPQRGRFYKPKSSTTPNTAQITREQNKSQLAGGGSSAGRGYGGK